MAQYIIVKQFIIGKKTYYKDKILSENISEELVKRLLSKGFIKSTLEASVDHEEIPFYEELKEFLTPKEVNRLKKAQMISYARHIGAAIDSTLSNAAIAKAINEFIAEATKEPDKEPEDDGKKNENDEDEGGEGEQNGTGKPSQSGV